MAGRLIRRLSACCDCESIKSGYLRATTTQYPYCDYECYSHYCESVARLREDLAGEESRIAS